VQLTQSHQLISLLSPPLSSLLIFKRNFEATVKILSQTFPRTLCSNHNHARCIKLRPKSRGTFTTAVKLPLNFLGFADKFPFFFHLSLSCINNFHCPPFKNLQNLGLQINTAYNRQATEPQTIANSKICQLILSNENQLKQRY